MFGNMETPSESASDDILLCNLEELYLVFEESTPIQEFIRSLTVPSAQVINLRRARESHHNLVFDSSILSHMIQRSNGMPNLNTLVIDRSQEPVEIGPLLLNASALKELYVTEGWFDDEIIEGIAMGRLGPSLKRLSCDTPHDAEKMLSMIELRDQNASMVIWDDNVPHFTALRSVKVTARIPNDIDSHAFQSIQNRIAHLKEVGVDILVV